MEGPSPEERKLPERHLKPIKEETARLEKSMEGRLEYMRRLILAEKSNKEKVEKSEKEEVEGEGGDCFPISKEGGLMGGFPFGEGKGGGEM